MEPSDTITIPVIVTALSAAEVGVTGGVHVNAEPTVRMVFELVVIAAPGTPAHVRLLYPAGVAKDPVMVPLALWASR